MGFLKRFFRSRAAVQQLPTGSVTVDRDGHVVTYTVSSAYPKALLRDIGLRGAVHLPRGARSAGAACRNQHSFRQPQITARELRGGAVIFLLPQTAFSPSPTRSRL